MPILVEIGPVALEKKIFIFRNYLSLEKGVALYLINLNSLHPRMLCAILVEGEEEENVEILRTDLDGRRTTGDQKSSLQILAQVS